MQQSSPEEVYEQQAKILSGSLTLLKRKRNYLGWLRLFIVLAILFFIYYLFLNTAFWVWLVVAIGIAVFLYVLSADTDNNSTIANTERLLKINKEELNILKGKFYDRENGIAFLPDEHPYASDIDLFGRASVYQYINRCTSEQSKRMLANLLLHPSDKNTIIERQEAAKALARQVEWRQKFQALGMAKPLTFETEEKMKTWVAMPADLKQKIWQVLPLLQSIVTFSLLFSYIFGWITAGWFWLLILICFLFAKFTSAKVMKTYASLSKIENQVNTIYRQLLLVENLSPSSTLLNSYKSFLLSKGNGTQSIKQLNEILHRLDFRLNANVFVIINTFFLWDVRQTNNLNKWKEKYAASIPEWFCILTDIEILSTLAAVTFNHPDWVFPCVTNSHFTLVTEDVGHPLIKEEKRVTNSFTTEGTGRINVITGSNMAGKSTFLRCIAVNLILAQTGAPVCAKAFTFSPVMLYSSMRIADNLAENTSTFYAELKKLKSIIDEAKQHSKIFILLDEILRGTNSFDQHTGSVAFIRQLIRADAVAVIATHDVELANLQSEYPIAISNYHFDAEVEGEELYFDYKLKRGICQSMNASLLMKKIGIEM